MSDPSAGGQGKPGAKPPGRPPPKRGVVEWLKTREGKIVAGAGVAGIVVILALRRAASGGEEEGFSAAELQAGADGTLQDRLDQIGMDGGTLSEWITSATDLAGSLDQIRDLLDAQDPTNGGGGGGGGGGGKKKGTSPSAANRTALHRIGRVGKRTPIRKQARRFSKTYYGSTNPDLVEVMVRELVKRNPKLRGKTHIPGGFPLRVPRP